MKRILLIACFLIVLLGLTSGCGASKNSLRDDFCSYYSDVLTDKQTIVYDDFSVGVLSFEKEKTTYNPKVIIELLFSNNYNNDQSIYDFAKLSTAEQKSFLKNLGEMVIDYAKGNNWKNDYYLYVKLNCIYLGNIIYDYEKDIIYVPNNISLVLDMYERFGTFDKHDLEELDGGREYLLDNGFCYEQHGELEYNYSFERFDIYFHEGEFKTAFEKYSSPY